MFFSSKAATIHANSERLLPYALERSSFSDSRLIIVTSLFFPRIYSAIWFAYVVLPLHGLPHITTKGLRIHSFIVLFTWRVWQIRNWKRKNSEIMELHNCFFIENVLSLHPECSVSIHYEGRSDSVNVCSSENVV